MKPFFPYSSLVVLYSLLAILPFTLAKPVDPIPWSLLQSRAIAIRDPNLPTPSLHSTNNLSKRVRASSLPGGWSFIISSEDHFDHIGSAVSKLERFYDTMLDIIGLPQNSQLMAQYLSLADGPFELLFRLRDAAHQPTEHVPMVLVRAFLGLMLRRAEGGWAVKYTGWLMGPNGVCIDVVLQTTRAMMDIMDSAMDIYNQ
ncbi:MAG: hypothetical protein Q9181_005579 [Wetmoreana brouardii]